MLGRKDKANSKAKTILQSSFADTIIPLTVRPRSEAWFASEARRTLRWSTTCWATDEDDDDDENEGDNRVRNEGCWARMSSSSPTSKPRPTLISLPRREIWGMRMTSKKNTFTFCIRKKRNIEFMTGWRHEESPQKGQPVSQNRPNVTGVQWWCVFAELFKAKKTRKAHHYCPTHPEWTISVSVQIVIPHWVRERSRRQLVMRNVGEAFDQANRGALVICKNMNGNELRWARKRKRFDGRDGFLSCSRSRNRMNREPGMNWFEKDFSCLKKVKAERAKLEKKK